MSHKKALRDYDIKHIIESVGYDESLLHLYPKIIDEKAKDFYQLLKREGVEYKSILKELPEVTLTNVQQSWIKSMILDHRSRLFFDERQLVKLEETMKDVMPLFEEVDYIITGQSLDGDPYDNPDYQQHFRQILHSIQKKVLIKINRFGREKEGFYAPYRIEYSNKDDKFRLNVAFVERGKMINYSRLNIARITNITEVPKAKFPDDIESYVFNHKVKEPVEITLTDQRNGFDRCFIHLSNYERRAEYDEEDGESHIRIYYYDFEETELLITLMSYGPILEVLGPDEFRSKFVERVNRQVEVITNREKMKLLD